jgi:hypothetical protein
MTVSRDAEDGYASQFGSDGSGGDRGVGGYDQAEGEDEEQGKRKGLDHVPARRRRGTRLIYRIRNFLR